MRCSAVLPGKGDIWTHGQRKLAAMVNLRKGKKETMLLPLSSLMTHMQSTAPVGLLWPLLALDLILIVIALVDLIRRDPRTVRGKKIIWALIILFISTLGPICYFVLGRKEV